MNVLLKSKLIALLTILILVGTSCQKQSITSDTAKKHFMDLYDNIEFDMPVVVEPQFADYKVSIKDFGATGNGETLNTDAINNAIKNVSDKGGGKVVIPRGIWLTGPIALQNNVNLHLEFGALLLFSRDIDQYPVIKTSFEGLETFRCASPISGFKLKNVAITGSGIIDGSGDAWRPVKQNKLTERQWKNLVASGGVLNEKGTTWYPSEKSLKGAMGTGNFNVPTGLKTIEDYEQIKDFLRPVMISLVECKNVLLDGPTFQNSPSWNIHPLMCEDITLKNLTVRNPWYSQNGDGLDLESCKNAIVYNCSFDVGDDGICIKSGKNEDGRKRGMPTENVIVKECIVYHGHGGFVIGSEMSGGVRNMHVSNCTFIGTDVGLRFKSTRGRGGIVEHIYISNINMIDIPTEAIRFNLYYGGSSPIPEPDDTMALKEIKPVFMPVTEETPEFRHIYVKNTTCIGAKRAIKMVGLPEMKLNNFSFENINIIAENGIEITDADGIQFKNISVECENGPALAIASSKNISFDSIFYKANTEKAVIIGDKSTENISFSNTKLDKDKDIAFPKNAEGAVVIEP